MVRKTVKRMKQNKQSKGKQASTVGKIAKKVLRTVAAEGLNYLPIPKVAKNAIATVGAPLMERGLDWAFGRGAYRTRAGRLVNMPSKPVIIHKTEYIQDVLSSTGFNIQTGLINPANEALFPWLSNVASSYTKFRFVKLNFGFRSRAGSAISSTNNALGTVGMAIDYNPQTGAFTNKQSISDYEGCESYNPTQDFICGLECDPRVGMIKRDFYMDVNKPASFNPLDYYPGRFEIYTQGMQAADINIGELWVQYTVQLWAPRLLPVGYDPHNDQFTIAEGTPISTSNPIGNVAPIASENSNLGTSFQPITNGYQINFPGQSNPGLYKVTINYFFGSSCSIGVPTLGNATANMSTYASYLASGAYYWIAGSGTGISSLMFILDKTDSSAGSIQVTSQTMTSLSTTGPSDIFVEPVYLAPGPLTTLQINRDEKLIWSKVAHMLAHNRDRLNAICDKQLDDSQDEVILCGAATAPMPPSVPSSARSRRQYPHLGQ